MNEQATTAANCNFMIIYADFQSSYHDNFCAISETENLQLHFILLFINFGVENLVH